MSDEVSTPTVGDRLAAAGLSPEAVAEHLAAGRIRLDGQPVTDLSTPAPTGSRPTLAGS